MSGCKETPIQYINSGRESELSLQLTALRFLSLLVLAFAQSRVLFQGKIVVVACGLSRAITPRRWSIGRDRGT